MQNTLFPCTFEVKVVETYKSARLCAVFQVSLVKEIANIISNAEKLRKNVLSSSLRNQAVVPVCHEVTENITAWSYRSALPSNIE